MFIHICTNFTGNPVHAALISGMAGGDDRPSHVFVPCKNKALIGRNDPGLPGVAVAYFYVPAILRYFQLLKVAYVLWLMLGYIRRNGVDMSSRKVFAHTFWSDGVLAYLLSRIHRCRYIVAVRNTDINVFFRYGYHLRPLMRMIGAAADAVVSPSAAYLARVRGLSWLRVAPGKLAFIPNPLPAWWFDQMQRLDGAGPRDPCRGVFVGEFTRNKNLGAVIQAFTLLRARGMPVRLVCVGGSAERLQQVAGLPRLPEWIEARGRVDDRSQLAAIYRSSRFLIVPSIHETFGMVYLEALSQGCIIIHSRGQGVDGAFEGGDFHLAVDPADIAGMADAVCAAASSGYRATPESCRALLRPFSLDAVLEKYRALAALD